MKQQTKVSKMARTLALSILALSATVSGYEDACAQGDKAAGRKKALQCQTCHGLDGASKLPEAPNISGQIELYLVKALGEYKTGTRKNDMMSLVAPNLSDQDIQDLAAYFASIPITISKPE